jgi:hypothetical protein
MIIIGIVLIAAGIYWYSSRPSFIAQRLWYSIMKSRGVDTKAEVITRKAALKYYHRLRGKGLSSEEIYDLIILDITPEEEPYLSGIKAWCEESNREGGNFTPRDVFGDYIESWETLVNALEFGWRSRG